MGVVALSVYPNQAYQILVQLKKSTTQCCDFKYWYRIGQAELSIFMKIMEKYRKKIEK